MSRPQMPHRRPIVWRVLIRGHTRLTMAVRPAVLCAAIINTVMQDSGHVPRVRQTIKTLGTQQINMPAVPAVL